MAGSLAPHLFSVSAFRWDARVTIKSPDVGSVECGDGADSPQPPSLESLQRRHDAADQDWTRDWLKDDADPCRPA